MAAICMNPLCESYLRDVDTSFLERAVVGILGAHVTVLAPVARERAIYTGKAARIERREETVREGYLLSELSLNYLSYYIYTSLEGCRNKTGQTEVVSARKIYM